MISTPPLISLTSDFGVQSQGVGIMEGVIAGINPGARVIHLMHGLPDFDISAGARTMETVVNLPVGIHVCVVDPGVGTSRRALILKTKRGDYLIGPDNGVLMAAVSILGGLEMAIEITNPALMRQPVSPIFHGRDVFAPAAAHLSKGVVLKKFGPKIEPKTLMKSPYKEAIISPNGIDATVIHINKFGSLHLNITHEAWDAFGLKLGNLVEFTMHRNQNSNPGPGQNTLKLRFCTTFGEVKQGAPLILKDDYGRVEVALNCGNFATMHNVKVGDQCRIK